MLPPLSPPINLGTLCDMVAPLSLDDSNRAILSSYVVAVDVCPPLRFVVVQEVVGTLRLFAALQAVPVSICLMTTEDINSEHLYKINGWTNDTICCLLIHSPDGQMCLCVLDYPGYVFIRPLGNGHSSVLLRPLLS